MNILVVNGYVRQNKGDGALMSVLCEELQKSFPKATVRISSQENPLEDTQFESWQNVGSLNRYCFDPRTGKANHLLRLVLSCGVVAILPYIPGRFRASFLTLLPALLRLHLEALIRADLVVSMGGGYLNGDKSVMANICVYLMLAPLRLGKRLGACVICSPQSMGPFGTRFQRIIVTRTLKKIDLLLTREKKTNKILSELSNNFPIVSSVDSGFLLKTTVTLNLRRQLRIKPDGLLIGITVRRWLDPERQQAYEQAIAQTVDYLTRHHKASLVFIPQVTSSRGDDDDRHIARKIYKNITYKNHVHLLETHYTHQEIKAMYSELDFIIGTRFHSVIFSLTSLVPALAIEYEHKTSGIMHDLGLEAWVVKIEEATAEILIQKANELIASRDSYKKHLSKVLPAYIARAQKAMTLIKQVYASYR